MRRRSRALICAAVIGHGFEPRELSLRRGENVLPGGEARDQPGSLQTGAVVSSARRMMSHTLCRKRLALRDLGKREVFVVMQVKILALLFGEQLP